MRVRTLSFHLVRLLKGMKNQLDFQMTNGMGACSFYLGGLFIVRYKDVTIIVVLRVENPPVDSLLGSH